MDNLTFITGNPGKAEEISRYLGLPVEHVSLDLDEIQSLDLEEIVRDKAARAYEKVRRPVLVEDVSLVFSAFGKLPGRSSNGSSRNLGTRDCAAYLTQKKIKAASRRFATGFATGLRCGS